MKITSGDLLGLYCRSRPAGGRTHLIVYPRIFPVDTGLIPSLHPMGAFQAPRRHYILAVTRATRAHAEIRLGASTRAALGLQAASQALAA